MNFKDNYKDLSGWIHDYYCDYDGAQLIFDTTNNTYFECPLCGHKYFDEKRKRAWVLKYRYKIFSLLEGYSCKYLVEENHDYLSFIERVLDYYSINYKKFKIHDKEGNIYLEESNKGGRITSQGLNEAMIAIQIVNSINNISSYLNKNIKNRVYNKLFVEIYNLLKLQVNKIHNISCYIICAIGMMGIISSNQDMIDFAFNSKYSFYRQLDLGVTKDYIWFEGSFHYHLFVLQPILELLIIVKNFNYKIDSKYYELVKNMLIQCFKCSFSDCTLPSPNDGWPNRQLIDYKQVFLLGNKLFFGEFKKELDGILNNYNTCGTIHLLDTGFSILKNKYWNVFIKYHDNNLNHAHPDKLNVEIKFLNKFLTHDLSTSGYGSSISKEFYKKTYAHNTVVIDGKDQNLDCNNNIVFYNDTMIDARTKNVYENVDISRKIQLIENNIIDEVEVNSNNKKVDYFFHCDARLVTKIDFTNKENFDEYPYLENIKEVIIKSDEAVLEWNLSDEVITSKIDLNNKKLYICDSPDNPNSKNRTTLLIRSSNEKNALFKIEWEC